MSLNNRIKKLEGQMQLGVTQHIVVNEDKFEFLVNDGRNAPYKPPPIGLKLHKSDDFVRLIMGPYGSGKSTSCCAEIVLRACQMPRCHDGIRRARWAIVRNTYADLEATSLKTWVEWFGQLGMVSHKMHPRINYIHRFNDGYGVIELEIMFIALDRADQISLRKLKSLELTGVYLNELSEISEDALANFQGRVRRFPAKRDCTDKYFSGIIADTNPPPTDHWVYQKFEVDRPEKFKIFHQPPAVFKTKDGYRINPKAENLCHHTEGERYYLDMIAGQTEEFIKVYAMGQYGIVIHGKRVYTNYNDDLHSVDDLDIYENRPIRIRCDLGVVCPAILISQHVDGFLYVVKEFIGEYMTIKELMQVSVEPWLNENCKGMVVDTILVDPANTDDGIEQLEELRYIVDKAKTNKIDPRIGAVRELLNDLVNGKPKLQISRSGCPKLREGFLGKYYYKRVKVIGERKYLDVPYKNHPHSDIHDALQYDALDVVDVDFAKSVQEEETFDFDEYYHKRDRDDVAGY